MGKRRGEPLHPLAGVIEKYNRFKEQFDELLDEMDDFFKQEPKPHFSRGYFDAETWEWIERFQIREEPPLRFGVILGDCVHNLRSALDHLMCQVTMLDGGTRDDCARTQFPIVDESEARFEAMANRQIPLLSKKHRALVRKTQPYRAGDEAWRHPLAILRELLQRRQTHRLINPTYSVVTGDVPGLLDRLASGYEREGPSAVVAWFMAKEGQRLEHDAAWFRIVFNREILTKPVKVRMSGNLPLGIGFGEVGLDADSFRRLAEYVLRVIEAFMRSFPETKYV